MFRISWFLPALGIAIGLHVFVPAIGATRPPEADSLRWGRSEPIAEVRVDANGDTVPDRVGDTVTVSGRVTAGRDRLAVPVPEIAVIQDSTAGIHVLLPNDSSMSAGDSVRVRGVVDQAYGLTRIQSLDHRILDVPSRFPLPLPLTVPAAVGERYEGRLVQVRGRIATKDSNEGGSYLLLTNREGTMGAQLTVFVADRHAGRFELVRFEEGDEIKVTGVVGQHDFEAPYEDYYQLEPRSNEDLAQIGWMSTYLRWGMIVFGGGGLVAVIAVFVLQAAVRRRTEELAESRARFRRLAEATSEGIALHEADGEIIDANTALANMVGLEREELIGRNVTDILPEAATGTPQDVEGDTEVPTETELVPEHGATIPVEIEERDVVKGSKTVHVWVVRDISKRKEWETEILIAKQEAEQMSKLKSNLINNMSHELRTPVTNITGYAEVIMDEADGSLERFAAQIRESGKRLSETLQSVLDMARIEAGTLDIFVQEVSVSTVVQEVVERYENGKTDAALSMEVDVPGDATLRTDRALLHRILNNLVQNAVKFTDQGTVRVKVTSTSDGIQVVVCDTGVGIAQEFQPRLFDPFKQESEGVAREYEGVGLGLSLTKRMVSILGGSIGVESTKGEGSVFTVELPSQIETGEPAIPDAEEVL